MHSVSNLGARKFGREDLPTIGFATRRILRGIEITSTRIRSSADWSREQLNIVAALRFQATSWMCGPGRARLQSCPSRNLRECEFFFCGGGENITGGARLLVVPLGPRFRSVIPRNFSSEESALQLLRDREQSFPRRLPPARDYERRGCIGTAEALPFPALSNPRADTIGLRFVSGHAFMRAVRVARFGSCRGRRRRGHYGRGTTFSRAVMAALSFCHSEELRFRGICFAASPDREQGFPRRLPPARDDERRSSIGTSKLVPFPKSARM